MVSYVDEQGKQQEMTVSDDVVQVERGVFAWKETPCLRDVSFRIPRGTLVAIVGGVGSGKSSLLSLLLGEMRHLGGSVCVNGATALSEQRPWLLNDTVRANVLYTSAFDPEKYQRTLKACCLEQDIQAFPGGDQYVVGEGGENCSGGQRARISLARCCYSDAPVVLLDDPLAAVDAQVSALLFRECIQKAMAGRTRLLVTNSPEVAERCDMVLEVANGTVVPTAKSAVKPSPVATEDAALGDLQEGEVSVLEEEKAVGRVPWSAYRFYLTSFGVVLLVVVLVCFACATICSVSSTFLLAAWSSDSACEQSAESIVFSDGNDATTCSDATRHYLFRYLALFLGSVVFLLLRTILVIPGRIRASEKLHGELSSAVLSASMDFHDTTPTGVVLNRFSKDMSVVDSTLPVSLFSFLLYLFQLLGEMASISLSISPLMLVVLLLSFFLYIRMHQSFRGPNTDIQRLEVLSQAPVLSRYQCLLEGLPSIHAFGGLPPFLAEMQPLLVRSNHVTQIGQHMATYLTWRSDLLAAAISAATAVVANLMRTRLTPGRLGIALTSSSGINGLLKYLIQQMVAMEANMNSVARIQDYLVSLPRESEEASLAVPSDWPSRGRIVFDNVQMRYGDGPVVLKGVSFTVEPKEKIGIVGRTGAGKSSLSVALFRLRPLFGGQIVIDEVDAAALPLRRLRSSLGIVPQDPTLFAASVRFNLDPRGTHSDETIWSAIESVGLSKRIQELPSALDSAVEEGGRNFSVGERQLLCLARVILQHPVIVVMDEATASLDERTQATVMRTIETEFSNCTVLTVAHRLATIMDSDKVCVMDDGRVAEFDSPSHLLSSQGVFYQMAGASL